MAEASQLAVAKQSERATGSASAAERRGNPTDSLPFSVAEVPGDECRISLRVGDFQPPEWALALHTLAATEPILRARRRGWPGRRRWTFDGPGPHLRCAPEGARWPALRPHAGVAFEVVLTGQEAVFRAHREVASEDTLRTLAAAALALLSRAP